MNGTVQTVDVFRALADEVRLRLLRTLIGTELSVAELVTVMGLPQSTVSRHLKPLRDAGLVETRREGTSVYYRKGPPASGDLYKLLASRLRNLPEAERDSLAVRRVLDMRRKRSREFFDKIAGRYGALTQPGGGWEALATAMAAGFAGRTVADLGCGEGVLTLLLARFAESVSAVDTSSSMLKEVRQRARKDGLADRVNTVEGDLEDIPMGDASVDAAFLSQSLHHAARPAMAIKEASRILKANGLLIVLDLQKHEQEWVREQWADQWLGFEQSEMQTWMKEAGLQTLVTERLAGATPELAVLMAVGQKVGRTTSNTQHRTSKL